MPTLTRVVFVRYQAHHQRSVPIGPIKRARLLWHVSVAAPTERDWHAGQLDDYHFGPTVQEAAGRYLGALPQ